MLIENQQLNIDYLKLLFNDIKWYKKVRVLSPTKKEDFYIGKYEDSEKVIKITVRPSKRAQVSESFKNRLLDGRIPPENYTGQTCDFGTTIEVLFEDSIITKITESLQEHKEQEIQKISW